MSPRTVRRATGHQSGHPKLIALLDGHVVGEIYQLATGQLRFVYDAAWRANPDAYPLSLSMPLTASEHRHQAINAFLWGLLPDNTRTLELYGRQFGVSSGNPVALLAHLGADCAGAVQFATPENLDEVRGASSARQRVEWISETEVAAELRSVREQGIPGTENRTFGRFSLAGAQPKIALLERDGRWGRPGGRTPTNRILKPPSREFAGFAENEHFCLDLARELGLGAVRSRVLRFDDEVAVVVDRFDRLENDGKCRRIHQEDICQALAIPPTQKYENEGGPGIAKIISLVRASSQEPASDVDRFVDATLLNWVLVATDAHAKNYALLHGPRGGVRLAPFYDVASYLPYAGRRLHQVKLAMSIGGEYLARRIVRPQWSRLAKQNNLAEDAVLERGRRLLQALPEAAQRVRTRSMGEGLDRSTIENLCALVLQRSEGCGAAI